MKTSILAICTLLVSSLAIAQDIYSSHTDAMVGCYKRVYSQAHLAKNPKQKVKSIQLSVYKRGDDLNLDIAATDRKGVTYFGYSDSADVLSARPEGVYLPSNDVMVTTEYDSGTYYVNFAKKVTISISKGATLSLYSKSEGDAVVGEKSLVLHGGSTNGLYRLERLTARQCR